MAKRYARLNWQNKPSVATPINATNLNKMDKGIDDCDNAIEEIYAKRVNNVVTTNTDTFLAGPVGKLLQDQITTINNNLGDVSSQLAEKANRDEVTNVLTPKGNIAYASLPSTGNEVGWYYYCPDGDGTNGPGNYVWNGTEWYFGGTGDEGYSNLKSDLKPIFDTQVIDNLSDFSGETTGVAKKRCIIMQLPKTDYRRFVSLNIPFKRMNESTGKSIYKIEIWRKEEDNIVLIDTKDIELSDVSSPTLSSINILNMYEISYESIITIRAVTFGINSIAYYKETDSSFSLFDDITSDILSIENMRTVVGYRSAYILKTNIYYNYIRQKENICTKVVDINGNGDYTSVVEAVENEPEGTVIYIMPGEYKGTVQAFQKRIILIGTDRNKCILKSTDGRYDYPPINGSCGYLENLTLYHQYVYGESNEIGSTESGGYAFHCENEYGANDSLEFHHCILKSDFFPALGAGLRKGFHLILDDCELENNQIEGRGNYSDSGTLGALYVHDSNGEQGEQYITIKNCILKSKLGNSMTLYKVNRTTQENQVHCEFINNVLYDETNGYSNNIWYRNEPFGESGIFDITLGYGNSNPELNRV